jgi:hypothetical protein
LFQKRYEFFHYMVFLSTFCQIELKYLEKEIVFSPPNI